MVLIPFAKKQILNKFSKSSYLIFWLKFIILQKYKMREIRQLNKKVENLFNIENFEEDFFYFYFKGKYDAFFKVIIS